MVLNLNAMKEREYMIEFHRNYCVHYQPREPLCGAGMDCQKIPRVAPEGDRVKWAPCIKGHLVSDPLALCPHWERRSREDGESYADGFIALMKRMEVVDPVINAWRSKPPIGKSEVIECPACKGRLHLAQAACNGHVRAKCETEDCVAFIE